MNKLCAQGKRLFIEITTPDFSNFEKPLRIKQPFLNSPVLPVNWQRHVQGWHIVSEDDIAYATWSLVLGRQVSSLVPRRFHTRVRLASLPV